MPQNEQFYQRPTANAKQNVGCLTWQICTTLFNDGFDGQMVRQRSGHRSTAVDSYKRPWDSLLHSISNSLQPPPPPPKKNKI